MKKIEALVIPDVHGRAFWKEAINKFPKDQFPDLKIIFLGDYLDPYTGYEPYTPDSALSNFKEILDYALNDDRIIMLIGNHDWHYFVNLDTCRMDRKNERVIKHLFIDNITHFKLTYILELNNHKYVFSHAGITQKWLNDIASLAKDELYKWNSGYSNSNDYISPELDENYKWLEKISNVNTTYDIELFEKCLINYDKTFYTAPISMISYDRGGWNPHGSFIWADVNEHLNCEDITNFYQIFAHTISYPTNQYDYAISPDNHNWAMIDASQAFIIDNEENIELLKNFK